MRCRTCGEQFWGTGAFCSIKCREENERIQSLAKKMKVRKEKKKVLKDPLAIENDKAREAGMSYGQYVAWQQSERERKIRIAKKEKNNGEKR